MTLLSEKNVIIRQNVTLGRKGNEKSTQEKIHPTIEDNVSIGAGSVILGGITVGKNAVVTKDVPSNAVVVGVPGTIIKYIEA